MILNKVIDNDLSPYFFAGINYFHIFVASTERYLNEWCRSNGK